MRLIFMTALLCASLLSFGQNDQSSEMLAVSLQEAIEIAKQNNLKLKDQELDIEIARTKVNQTKAQGLPQVNGSFDYTRTLLNAFAKRTGGTPSLPQAQGQLFTQPQLDEIQGVSAQTVGGFFSGLGEAFASKHQSNLGVTANQQLFNGVYLLGLKAAEVYVELSEVQTKPTERDIEKNVERAYYAALITQENIDILDKNIENLNELLFETREIYKQGFAEQLDIDRLVLSQTTLKNSRRNLTEINALGYKALKNAMNVSLDTDLTLTESIDSFEEYTLSDEMIANISQAEQWPEFQIFDVQEKITKLDIARFEKGKLPQVNAFVNGSFGYQGNDFIFKNGFDNWFPNLAAGLSVAIPIFDGNLRKNQIKQRQIELKKIEVARKNLQQNIDISAENAMTNFANNKQDLETQIENIKLAEKIYNVTQIKYKEGVGSSLELYQAQQDLYSAQQSYINALFNLLNSKVDLEQALGK